MLFGIKNKPMGLCNHWSFYSIDCTGLIFGISLKKTNEQQGYQLKT